MRNITFDTPAHEAFSIALCSEGQYGVDKGLIFSFPCRTKNGRVEVITDLPLNAFNRARLQLSLEELRQEYHMVKELGLIT